MSKIQKLYELIMDGRYDNNIKFSDLQRILAYFSFNVRIKGDHFIYYKDGIVETINIQPRCNKAKPYQVKQIRYLFLKYHLEV